jgi:hypothetical protein
MDTSIKSLRDKDNLADDCGISDAIGVAEAGYVGLGHWLRSTSSAALSANLIAASNRSIARLGGAVKRGQSRPANIHQFPRITHSTNTINIHLPRDYFI